jgi:hypothetical protein
MRDVLPIGRVSQLAYREACVKQNARRALREARLASQSNERRGSPKARLAIGFPGARGGKCETRPREGASLIFVV